MKRRLFGFSTLIVINLVGIAVLGAITVARSKPQTYPTNTRVFLPIVDNSWIPAWGGAPVAITGGGYANIMPVGPMPNFSQNNAQPNVLPQTTGRVVLRRDDANKRIVMTWEGEPNAVRRILVATIDRNKHTLERHIITRLPATASLAKTSKVAAAGVYIEYINGANSTFLVTSF
jgi:hypothetical protein